MSRLVELPHPASILSATRAAVQPLSMIQARIYNTVTHAAPILVGCTPTLQMIELLDHIPRSVATSGRYAREVFTREGRLRHIHRLNFWPLDRVLEEKYKLPREEVRCFVLQQPCGLGAGTGGALLALTALSMCWAWGVCALWGQARHVPCQACISPPRRMDASMLVS